MAHFGDKLSAFLKNASVKIEELQVQAALGKAEASDKLEELKKETRAKYQEVKSEFRSEIADATDEYNHLKAKLEHLELQLALGRAESSEQIAEQKKKISEAFSDVKNLIKKD